ncbi:3'-5' exonuclease-like [Lolium perenne]|uniref:3'-5' exonuclease-like n=1 Tax=Lolium perenne TaxID=4522 RepID=UPI0021F54B29|nr:3'-5' exonuclease-like [Lolium perenne]
MAVGLDCESTDPREGRANQRAAILQLSIAQQTLVFHVVHADEVPQLLIDFLADKNIRFCGAAIHNDLNMLHSYNIIGIPYAINLQQILQNPVPNKQTPSLYDLANHYIGTGLGKKKKFNKKNKLPKTSKELAEEDALIFGWGNFPLSHKKLQYAALDALLGFELGRRHFRALGYNS